RGCRSAGLLLGYDRDQVAPPSTVENRSPRAERTVALSSLEAETWTISSVVGGVTACQLRPSIVRTTAPPFPPAHQTPAEGAEAASSGGVLGPSCSRQLWPWSSERRICAASMRQRTSSFERAITTIPAGASPSFCIGWLASSSGERGGSSASGA